MKPGSSSSEYPVALGRAGAHVLPLCWDGSSRQAHAGPSASQLQVTWPPAPPRCHRTPALFSPGYTALSRFPPGSVKLREDGRSSPAQGTCLSPSSLCSWGSSDVCELRDPGNHSLSGFGFRKGMNQSCSSECLVALLGQRQPVVLERALVRHHGLCIPDLDPLPGLLGH